MRISLDSALNLLLAGGRLAAPDRPRSPQVIGPTTRAIWRAPSIRRSIRSLRLTSRSWLPPGHFSMKSDPPRAGGAADPFAMPGAPVADHIRRHADRRQRRNVFARGHARGGARRRQRLGNLELRAALGRGVAARRRLLAGRQAESSARPVYFRLEINRAEREYRQDRSWIRQRRPSGHGGAVLWRPDHLQERRDDRRHGGRSPRRSGGRFARLRCPHRREALGFSFGAASGRTGSRDLARRRLEGALGRERLGLVHDRG